ncbi:methyl-accepting chemotaxis protein [uncultured Clostridium sp.]|uniref:methyl-accepting chemotaxis protein n=1 Tax=uncultured Clostridium sp. TaxID=59620 RepID=UPI0028EA3BB7|nr:methyl-accepting chemotaxis protein [uncultured Clostridium sp.]
MEKYKIIIYILIAMQIVWILLTVFLTRQLREKSNKVNNLLFNISQGDLTQKIDVEKKGFLHSLHSNLNNLVAKFRNLVAQIITLTDKTINYTSELNMDTMKINASTKETVKVINEIAKSMEGQIASIKDAEKYSCEAMDTARKIVKKSEEVSQRANITIETIDASYENFESLIEKLDESAKASAETANRIKQLENQTILIQSIADKVSKISKSTNLLALNASIEAARAGEAGKGFAVVADEVRKLAEDSTVQSKQIQQVVDGIKEEIHSITNYMEEEIHSIKEYVNFSYTTREYLKKINTETKGTFDVFSEISSQIDEQENKIDKVVDIIKNTSYTFESIAASTEEMAASAEEQANTTEETFKRLSNLLDMNKEIEQYIAAFVKNYKIDGNTQRYIENGIKILREISKAPCLSAMEYSSSTAYLKEELIKYPEFELLATMQEDGMRKAITLDYKEQEVYVNFAHRPYFKEAITGKEFMSKPYISVDTNNYCIAMAVPVKDNLGKVTGILMADLRL